MPRDYVTNFRGDVCFTPNGNIRVKEEPISPDDNDFGEHNKLDFFENGFTAMRKSLSMNDIAILKQELSNLNFENDEDGVCERYHKQTGGNQELSKTKFVSMAEAIYHYERDTPGRFRTTKPKLFQPQQVMSRSRLTIAQSPMLRCKTRARPRHIMSQKEKEEMELEEIKKFKIKANPIPKSVIIGPVHLPDVPRKPMTVPEPFKLTEFHKKNMQSPEQAHHFKARPAPKHILEKPQIPIKPITNITKPVSPKFHYKRANSTDCLKHENKQCDIATKAKNQEKTEKHIVRHGPVKPEPFSFEKRDEESKRRREERIKKQLEEERKMASQFKAQPLPNSVKKRMHSATGIGSTASSENKENHVKFEAKPPVVLYKEPFKPVLQANPISKPVPFELTTEKRAAERERFEKQIKEKEKEMEKNKQLKEQEQREAEERAIAQLRSTLVHHPKPIPSLNPFIPEKSAGPLTVPETPKFVRRLKQK
ncbi:targeting protein for Xklp2-like [Colias croceus]|uniref:targeting protein for Xklp2-like n=1 Tax=Colias crocea TaxID=72248 RepID=UPI001E280BAE|nr:targeting protein for Xklp2-like [Colias croceus]